MAAVGAPTDCARGLAPTDRSRAVHCWLQTFEAAVPLFDSASGRAGACAAVNSECTRPVQRSAAQCSAAQCSSMQRSAVRRSAAQCTSVQCSSMQCSAAQHSAVQRSPVQCSAVQCSAVQRSAAQCTVHNSVASRPKCWCRQIRPLQSIYPVYKLLLDAGLIMVVMVMMCAPNVAAQWV